LIIVVILLCVFLDALWQELGRPICLEGIFGLTLRHSSPFLEEHFQKDITIHYRLVIHWYLVTICYELDLRDIHLEDWIEDIVGQTVGDKNVFRYLEECFLGRGHNSGNVPLKDEL